MKVFSFATRQWVLWTLSLWYMGMGLQVEGARPSKRSLTSNDDSETTASYKIFPQLRRSRRRVNHVQPETQQLPETTNLDHRETMEEQEMMPKPQQKAANMLPGVPENTMEKAANQLPAYRDESLAKTANAMPKKSNDGIVEGNTMEKAANQLPAYRDESLAKTANTMPKKSNDGLVEGNTMEKAANQLPAYRDETLAKTANTMPKKSNDGLVEKTANTMPKKSSGSRPTYPEVEKTSNSMPKKSNAGLAIPQKTGNSMPKKSNDGLIEKTSNMMPDGAAASSTGESEKHVSFSEDIEKIPNGMDMPNAQDNYYYEATDTYQNEGGDPQQEYDNYDGDLEKSGNFIDVLIGPHQENKRGGSPKSGGGGGYNYPWKTGGSGTQWEMAMMRDYLAIADVTHDKVPLGIENGAPDFSCFISANGNVGLGTSYPAGNLHIVGETPFIRFEDGYDKGAYGPKAWDVSGNTGGFYVYEESRDRRLLPFKIESGAKSLSLVVSQKGNVGMGTDLPTSKLHVAGNARIDGTLQVGQCQLDNNSCQWKRFSRRGTRGLQEDGTAFEDDQDDAGYWQDHVELLEQENGRLSKSVQTLESRLSNLESMLVEKEALWVEELRVLRNEMEDLKQEKETVSI